ncbi:MAG: RNA polymerase subunit sigma-24 [Butyricimonas synergistica]|nr:MAG: RNA polymerase subunit sigma-24 [Butyricimonas synergistica]
MLSDSEILGAFQQDMNEGGKLLFQRYYKPLVLFSGSMLDDCSFPEDIVQDVFYQFIRTKAWRNLVPSALSTYLFRSVKNACLNKIRDLREFSKVELLMYDTIEEEATTISPELIDAIREAIQKLPEKTRAVVTAIVVEGKKYKEAAEELEVSVNTIKTLLSTGLKQLRQQFPDSLLLLFMVKRFF